MKSIHLWTSGASHLVLALNVLLCIILRKQLPSFFSWFTLFLATGLVIQILARILLHQQLNNLPLLHIYTLLEFLFLSLFYRNVLRKIKLSYFPHFIAGLTLLIILNSLFIQPPTTFNSIAKTATQLIYIGYSLLYFFAIPKREDILLTRISSAILIYYSGSLFIFMFTNVLTRLKDLVPYYNNYLWFTNVLLYLVFQLIVLYTLWKTGWRQTKSSP